MQLALYHMLLMIGRVSVRFAGHSYDSPRSRMSYYVAADEPETGPQGYPCRRSEKGTFEHTISPMISFHGATASTCLFASFPEATDRPEKLVKPNDISSVVLFPVSGLLSRLIEPLIAVGQLL